jgi:hypothetical protein
MPEHPFQMAELPFQMVELGYQLDNFILIIN